jgi:hypothetical protein
MHVPHVLPGVEHCDLIKYRYQYHKHYPVFGELRKGGARTVFIRKELTDIKDRWKHYGS